MQKRIFSGAQPTGNLHIGNHLGALRNWVELQDRFEGYSFVADWHALTTDYDNTGKLQQHVHELLLRRRPARHHHPARPREARGEDEAGRAHLPRGGR